MQKWLRDLACVQLLTGLNCMLGKQYNITKIPHRPLWLWVHSYIENTDSHTVDEGTIASKVQELVVTQNTDTLFSHSSGLDGLKK